MVITSENILIMVAVLIFTGIVISRAGFKFGLPVLLLFLMAGMLFGVDGLGIQFSNMKLAQFIGTVALCVILFTGGVETSVKEIRPVLGPGLVLSTLGVLLTTVFTGLFIFGLSQWDWCSIGLPLFVCLLLAATMSSTDSASVFNILRNSKMKLKNNLQPMLELESGSNDPMAYILTIVLIQIVTALSGEGAADLSAWAVTKDALVTLVLQFGVGCVMGALMGYFSVWCMNKIKLNNTPLYAIMLLSISFFTFSVTGYLQGNGYLAIYIAGIVIGNHKLPDRKNILSFLDGMTWLMQIIMFLALGLLVNPREMLQVAPVALLIGVFMILVARPLSVYLSLIPFRKIGGKDKAFVSWVGLRGAVPIIFATYPVVAEVEGADIIFNVVFFITLVSLIVQGSSIPLVARKLGLNDETPDEQGQFGVEIPEEAGQLAEISLTEESLEHGNTLKELKLPAGMLVMMIKRDGKFIVPNGSVELRAGDRLLILSESGEELR